MDKLTFDSGIKEYEVNGRSVLRFNPSDPNVYGRFLDAVEKIKAIEDEMVKNGRKSTDGESVVRVMVSADKNVKEVLQNVFGKQNDFDSIFDGVNIMAVASNGERVITNFMSAIEPIISEGAEKCAKQKVNEAVKAARMDRDRRVNA